MRYGKETQTTYRSVRRKQGLAFSILFPEKKINTLLRLTDGYLSHSIDFYYSLSRNKLYTSISVITTKCLC